MPMGIDGRYGFHIKLLHGFHIKLLHGNQPIARFRRCPSARTVQRGKMKGSIETLSQVLFLLRTFRTRHEHPLPDRQDPRTRDTLRGRNLGTRLQQQPVQQRPAHRHLRLRLRSREPRHGLPGSGNWQAADARRDPGRLDSWVRRRNGGSPPRGWCVRA